MLHCGRSTRRTAGTHVLQPTQEVGFSGFSRQVLPAQLANWQMSAFKGCGARGTIDYDDGDDDDDDKMMTNSINSRMIGGAQERMCYWLAFDVNKAGIHCSLSALASMSSCVMG